MSNYVINAGTNYGSIAGAAAHEQTTEQYVGPIRRTGVSWVAGWNYVSHYNWSIGNWEFVGGEKKRQMRGEPILLNRVVLFFILVFTAHVCIQAHFLNLSKYHLITTIFIGLVDAINTIWNWHVYVVNGNRIHQHMFFVSDSILDRTNEFYIIPIHTRITDRRTLMVADQISVLIAQLIQQNQSSISVKIMLYGVNYLKKISFPFESVLVFLLSVSAISFAGFSLVTLP